MAPVISFLPSGRRAQIEAGETLHDAVRRAGLPIASACGADGLCGRCGVRVLEGAAQLPPEDAHETQVKRRNRVDSELRLACRVVPAGDVTLTASYW